MLSSDSPTLEALHNSCMPFHSFGSAVSKFTRGYFRLVEVPTSDLQTYTEWSERFVRMHYQEDSEAFLESRQSRIMLQSFLSRCILVRCSILLFAYLFPKHELFLILVIVVSSGDQWNDYCCNLWRL